jgi:hypothetical protein
MIALSQAAERSDEAPDYSDNGDIARGAELLQEKIGGDFEKLGELVNIQKSVGNCGALRSK